MPNDYPQPLNYVEPSARQWEMQPYSEGYEVQPAPDYALAPYRYGLRPYPRVRIPYRLLTRPPWRLPPEWYYRPDAWVIADQPWAAQM